MSGPPPKALGRQRPRRMTAIPTLTPIAERPLEPPEPPQGLLVALRRDWDAFWLSPMSQAVVPATDLPALRRLWILRDSAARYERLIRREPFALGAKRQVRANPLASLLMATLAEARQLEDRFGLSPLARLRLGVTLGDAARSLADLNAEVALLAAGDDPHDVALLATLQREPE